MAFTRLLVLGLAGFVLVAAADVEPAFAQKKGGGGGVFKGGGGGGGGIPKFNPGGGGGGGIGLPRNNPGIGGQLPAPKSINIGNIAPRQINQGNINNFAPKAVNQGTINIAPRIANGNGGPLNQTPPLRNNNINLGGINNPQRGPTVNNLNLRQNNINIGGIGQKSAAPLSLRGNRPLGGTAAVVNRNNINLSTRAVGPANRPIVINNNRTNVVVNNRRGYGFGPGFGVGFGLGVGVPLATRIIAPPIAYPVEAYPAFAPVFIGTAGLLLPETVVTEPDAFVPETIPQPQEQGPAQGQGQADWGLRITEVVPAGPAQKADLRPGDVIVGVGDSRVQTLDDLKQLLGGARGEVDVIFINGESGKLERLPVTPDSGRIGVAVEVIDLN